MRQPGRRQTARYPPPPRARAHTHPRRTLIPRTHPRRTLIPRQRSATLLHPTWALGGSSGARSVDRHWVRKEEDKRWCKNNCSCGSRVGGQGRLETVPAYQKHRGLPASCQYASSTQLARYHPSLSDLGLRVSRALCNVAAVGSQCPYACGRRLNCTHTRPRLAALTHITSPPAPRTHIHCQTCRDPAGVQRCSRGAEGLPALR